MKEEQKDLDTKLAIDLSIIIKELLIEKTKKETS